jgi:hypothetical protein
MPPHNIGKTFANGRGFVNKPKGSTTLHLSWDGQPAGEARYIPHVKRFSRLGKEYKSLAELLKHVEAEHSGKPDRQN